MRDDVPRIAELMYEYMEETYSAAWVWLFGCSFAGWLRPNFDLQVAVAELGQLIAVPCWRIAYDLHHCIAGGEVIDMFVSPPFRGRGIGPLLVCAVAAQIEQRGGAFLRGQALDEASASKLYGRVAMTADTLECTIGGRAFRSVAASMGRPVKEIARSLPPKAWNYEA